MKIMTIAIMAFAMSSTTFAGVKTFYQTGESTYDVHQKFTIDPFSNLDAYTFCFTGSVSNVCPEIGFSEEQSNREYADGMHGFFEVTACNMVTADLANVSVNVVTDYGDDDNKNYEIKRCTLEQAVE